MSRFSQTIHSIVDSSFAKISLPESGVVVGYDHETMMAQITTVNKSGQGNRVIEVPWPSTPGGIFASAPTIGVTQVTVAYRGGNYCEPTVLNAYDPTHYVGRRERECRSVDNYTTKADANLI